jgi:hypothetical protein
MTVCKTFHAIATPSASGCTAIEPTSVRPARIRRVIDERSQRVASGCGTVRVVGMYWAVMLRCGSLSAPSTARARRGKFVDVLIVGQAQ